MRLIFGKRLVANVISYSEAITRISSYRLPMAAVRHRLNTELNNDSGLIARLSFNSRSMG